MLTYGSFRVSIPAVVTTCTLDTSERRLFTGAHDGSVCAWNFNSGVMLYQLLTCVMMMLYQLLTRFTSC